VSSPNAAREVVARLKAIRQAAATEAPLAACRALAQAAETAVKVTLTSSTHRAGTPTPSSPGQPPSLVTGRLRRSVTHTSPRLVDPGVAMSLVGSVMTYASVHEFGPVTITSHGSYPLRNRQTGQVFGREVTIPRRQFLEPATRRLESSGIGTRVASEAFTAALGL
jgi:phage gpG-like protein